MMRWPGSLRARLLVSLLAAILLTALAQGWTAYRTARAEADQIFDIQMRQMAMSLRAGLHSRMPGQDGMPPGDRTDDGNDGIGFVLQVWSADGIRVYQSSARVALPDRAVLGFSDVSADGSKYRVFSLQTPSQVIQVAQDMAIRREMAGTLALRTVAPIAVMAPVLMLLAWWVVSASLVPVARVRRQLAQRQADDLTPVGEADLPDEIRPLVHELNLLLERVRQAFDAQTHFVADAAHELRSPLAALQLQAEGLQRAADGPARELAVQRLKAGIERASRLVEQLLALARQQASAASGARMQALDLATLVREVVADVAANATDATDATHATHATHAANEVNAANEANSVNSINSANFANFANYANDGNYAGLPAGIDMGLVQADAGLIQGHAEALRVLCRNLLDNALKYTPAPGRIDLAVLRSGEQLLLRIDDSGPGIPEAERARVLDRFVRLPSQAANTTAVAAGTTATTATANVTANGTTTATANVTANGSGLGLAIVKAIADLHGATLALTASPTLGGLRVELGFALAAAAPRGPSEA